MGAPYSRGGMLNGGTSRACCAGAAGSGALGCYGTPSSTVAFAGDKTSFFIFTCTGGAGTVVTGTVSGANLYKPGVGEIIVLGFALIMF